MADASFLQTSFLGGEWSPLTQGRMDDKTYRTGMNVCRNTIPVEEGAATRRPGVRMTVATRKGAKGVLRAFDFTQNAPYELELTASHMRLLSNGALVLETAGQILVSSISSAKPAVVTVSAPTTWATLDEVQFAQDPGDTPNYTLSPLFGRELEITVLSSTTFSISDALTGEAIDGSTITLGTSNVLVARVADFITPYQNSDLDAINITQDEDALLILHGRYPTQSVLSTTSPSDANFAVFTIGAADFLDGPYLDPPKDGTTITASALTGSVTLTLAGGATRFTPITDIGRLVRMFSEPAAWAIGTGYAIGDQVKYHDAYYVALKASTGKFPDSDVVDWGVDVTAAAWTWAQITAVTSTTVATATIRGDNILRTTACATWRLGLYSNSTGWPSTGTFHEGRFWLATPAQGNRIDGSKSNDIFNFAPTASDGTVADDNAPSYIFKATDVNTIFWIEPDAKGLIVGTQAGEWLVSATDQNDILTPTSVQAHRVTKIGCANIPPKRVGGAVAFVQRYGRKLIEYVTSDYRGMSGRNIAITGKHLTADAIHEIAYVKELAPVIWMRTDGGKLAGLTYKRESPYASDPPDFAGWHHHDLGSGWTVESIQAGPSLDGSTDSLSMICKDAATGWYYVHLMSDIFEPDDQIGDSYFVDSGQSPSMVELRTGSNPHVLRFYSLWRLVGKTISAFIGGVDCGDFTVTTGGYIDVPIDVPGGLLTTALLGTLSSTSNFHNLGLALQVTPAGNANVPSVVGIQNFDLSPMTHHNGGPAIDFDGRRLFLGNAFDGKIASYSMDTYKLLDGPVNSTLGNSGLIYAQDGYLYGVGVGGANSSSLVRMNSKTFAVLAHFGENNGAFAFTTTSTNWAVPRDMDTVTVNGATYLVSTAANFSQTSGQVSVLSLTNPDFAFAPIVWDGAQHNTDEFLGVVCKGRKIRNNGCAWVVTQTNNLGGSNTIGLYRVLIVFGTSSMTKIGLIDPTTIGTGWTHATTCPGIILDETDGNILAHFTTQDLAAWSSISSYVVGDLVHSGTHDFVSKTNPNLNHLPTVGGDANWTDLGVPGSFPVGEVAIVKINVHTGAIMWKVKVTTSVNSTQILNQSRIRYSRYTWLDTLSPNTKQHSINTLTGVDTTSGLLGSLIEGGPQFTDDYTGNVYADMNFAFSANPVPIGTTPSSFASWGTLGPGPASPAAAPPTAAVLDIVPTAIGFTYVSQGQILRPIAPDETGARNGPALGKTRRAHMFSALLNQTQGISFGTVFGKLHAGQLRTAGGTKLAANVLFSGTLQDTLEDDYSFDSMICWEIDRPYPAAVLTIGSFLHTQDR